MKASAHAAHAHAIVREGVEMAPLDEDHVRAKITWSEQDVGGEKLVVEVTVKNTKTRVSAKARAKRTASVPCAQALRRRLVDFCVSKAGTRHVQERFSLGYLKRDQTMENRTDYERNRSELDHRYAHPEWMKDNVGWVIGAVAIVLIIGGIYYVSAHHPRTASIPDDATTGQSTPPPMSPTPPVRF